MCKVNINNELNGIELSFDSKPASEVLTSLKDNGFKWHNKKKIWYAKISDDRLTFANTLSGTPSIMPVNEQKTLLDGIMREYNKLWSDTRMLDYCRKKCAYVVKLNDGYFEIEKPSIETHFCFGYGYCGVSTREDYDDAETARHNAATNQDYFIEENLKYINARIEELTTNDVYAYFNYNKNKDGEVPHIYYLICLKPWEIDRYDMRDGFYKLSYEEIEDVITGYKIVKSQFEKRLNTYLKKYGLSKLKTWTFLSD